MIRSMIDPPTYDDDALTMTVTVNANEVLLIVVFDCCERQNQSRSQALLLARAGKAVHLPMRRALVW